MKFISKSASLKTPTPDVSSHRWTDTLHDGRVRPRVGEGQGTVSAAELLAIYLGSGDSLTWRWRVTWWFIPRIVSGLVHPGYFHGISGGKVHL